MTFARSSYDAVVVGAGPNGLACAIRLAQKGLNVALVERSSSIGGGLKTEELTLPGFHHDTCSAVHPMGHASPFFRSLPLSDHGLRWIHGAAEVAHPFDDGTVALLKRTVATTAAGLGADGPRFTSAFSYFEKHATALMDAMLDPLLKIPKHPLLMARFGLQALMSADGYAGEHFEDDRTRALFLGIAAHSCGDLSTFASASIGVALTVAAFAGGWPFPQGGSGSLASALAAHFASLGGETITGVDVRSLRDLPESRLVFFDLTPRQILKIAGDELPSRVRSSFEAYRYGPGVFKIDFALNAPVPWKNRDTALAPTVHLGGSSGEIRDSEIDAVEGRTSRAPLMLVTQPSLFDASRAPIGKHTLWAYCHVPHASSVDMTDVLVQQIERFAPGFRDTILAKCVSGPAALEAKNPNLVGGDISGGLVDFKQIIFRPRPSLNPYALDGRRLWICSSSTPPGPAVHGMCGYHAANAATLTLTENGRSTNASSAQAAWSE